MRRHPISTILLVVLILALGTAGCAKKPKPETEAKQATPAPAAQQQRSRIKSPDPTIDRTGWPVIVAFGDSLTAGLGVPLEQNYPSQLQAELDERGYKYHVVNAGISGDTTAGGLNRVESVLQHNPAIVILELGANDGLQGKSTEQMEQNLAQIIERLQKTGAQVVLAGMHAPPNYGPEYTQSFYKVFEELARRYQLPFIPFILDQVGGVPELNLADGIHPTAEGYTIVVNRNLLPVLETVLKK
ncbi:MAG: arylesterase [Bacillota bacterium]